MLKFFFRPTIKICRTTHTQTQHANIILALRSQFLLSDIYATNMHGLRLFNRLVLYRNCEQMKLNLCTKASCCKYYTVSQKKWHWCCMLQPQSKWTDFLHITDRWMPCSICWCILNTNISYTSQSNGRVYYMEYSIHDWADVYSMYRARYLTVYSCSQAVLHLTLKSALLCPQMVEHHLKKMYYNNEAVF